MGKKIIDQKYDFKCSYTRHCVCGHSIDYYKNHDFIICTWCGRKVYKDDKTKFKYEIGRCLKCQYGNI